MDPASSKRGFQAAKCHNTDADGADIAFQNTPQGAPVHPGSLLDLDPPGAHILRGVNAGSTGGRTPAYPPCCCSCCCSIWQRCAQALTGPLQTFTHTADRGLLHAPISAIATVLHLSELLGVAGLLRQQPTACTGHCSVASCSFGTVHGLLLRPAVDNCPDRPP